VTDLTHDASDDGFHEIQLSGKQLVFLFMATTVVSVVIFLCGVLVGRGVRGEVVAANTPKVSTAGPAPSDTAPSAPPAVAESSTAAPSDGKLSYPDRLEGEKPAPENLKSKAASAPAPAESPAAVAPPTPQQPAVTATKPESAANATARKEEGTFSRPLPNAAPTAPPAEADSASAGPARGVWAVQVVALTDRSAAQAVVDRLKGKGYTAFLVSPQPGSAVKNYKVQVGRFEDRAKAQMAADRLKQEEQFVPWILR
jgi:cell division septation protein DedD